jgi:hypothetical protein
VAVALWLLAAGPLRAEQPIWEPAKTWVFAVGVLQFSDPGVQTYPEEGRVDAAMIKVLQERGVPPDQIVFIRNQQATQKHVSEELVKFLRKPAEDDTLLFYYTGHGMRDFNDPARSVCFLTYDTKSKWTVSRIIDAIEQNFKGSQALLMADCCFCGALAEEAARRAGRIKYGVLTSAQASSVSTSNWTFTECLVEILKGSPQVDLNGDGEIRFGEAAQYCDAEMAFCEEQRAGHAALGNFSSDTILAQTAIKKPARVGEHCEAQLRGLWLKAKIIQASDERFLIDWLGPNQLPNAWIKPVGLRPYQFKEKLAAGTPVLIEWNRTWYPGEILKSELGLYRVHYSGFPEHDDEWVPRRRLRTAAKR